MRGIRKRLSGNYEARVHVNGKAYRIGTFTTAKEAKVAYDLFIKDNPRKKEPRVAHTPFYTVWQNMKERCYRKSNKSYHRYGGRGITVCDEWKNSFKLFSDDMRDGYSNGLQLDRIDNNGIYSKDNCRWVSRSVNCANKSSVEGVRLLPSGNYFSSIKIEGTGYSLGTFKTKKEASNAFKVMHKEWYGF